MSQNSLLEIALENYQQGNVELALKKMQEVLLSEPNSLNVRVEFANMLMREKRFDDARELLNSLPENDKNTPSALTLFSQLESIEIVMNAPDIDKLLQIIQHEPSNCLVREQLAAHYKLRGDYVAAMNQLLEIVQRDRGYNNDVGRTEILRIFSLLSHEHELVGTYRRKLAQALN